MRKTPIAVIAAVMVTALSSPPNIGKGNYVYEPNSIPQNEKILKLFVRLAAHTANRLIRMKIESNPDFSGLRTFHEDSESRSSVTEDGTEENSDAVGIRVESKEDDDLEAGNELENTGAEVLREGISGRSDQPLIRDEITSSIDDETATPASGFEVANRALFSFEKNSYVTHYTDQSANTNRAETAVYNRGLSLPGNVVDRELGRLSNGSKEIQGSEKSRVELRKEVTLQFIPEESTQLANSGFESIGREQKGHRFHGISGKESWGLGTNVGEFYGGASSNEEKVHRGGLHGLQESKMRRESTAEDKRQQELNGFNISQDVRMAEEHRSAAGIIHAAQMHRATEFSGSAHSSLSGGLAEKSQQAFGSSFNVGGQTNLDVKHGGRAQIHNAIDFEKSAGLSSSGSASEQTQQTFGSVLNSGEKIVANLQRDSEAQIRQAADFEKSLQASNSEKLRSSSLEQVHGSISSAAKLQAGSTVKFGASKGLSAGIGLINAKMNLMHGAIKSKGNFDGELNLAAHVLGT